MLSLLHIIYIPCAYILLGLKDQYKFPNYNIMYWLYKYFNYSSPLSWNCLWLFKHEFRGIARVAKSLRWSTKRLLTCLYKDNVISLHCITVFKFRFAFWIPQYSPKNSMSCDLNILYRGSGGWIARVGRLFLSRALFWRVCNHIWIQSIHWWFLFHQPSVVYRKGFQLSLLTLGWMNVLTKHAKKI